MAGQNKLIAVFILAVFMLFSEGLLSQKQERKKLQRKITAFELDSDFDVKDTTYIILHCKLASSFNYINSDSLYYYSNKALTLSEKADFTRGKILSLSSLGSYNSNMGNSKEAISYFKKALELTQKDEANEDEVQLYNNLGTEYLFSGNYSKSLEYYLKGIDIATIKNDLTLLSILNENIASLYSDQKNYDQALEFYERVVKINRQLDDEVVSAETMSNMASLYADMDKFDLAMFNINSSITAFEKNAISDWLAFAYGVKGKIYLRQKKYDWALYWYDQANLLYENLDDKRGVIDVYDGYSKAFFAIKQDSLAEYYALKGNSIAKEIAAIEGQKNTAEILYKVYKNKSDFELAVLYLEEFEALSDSLSKDEFENSLTMMQTKMDYEKQKEAIIAEKEKVLARQRNYIYASLIVLLVLLCTSIPLYINQKKLVRLYKELKAKTKTLRDREDELKRIDKTKNQLFSIIGHDLRGPIGGLQGLLRLFANNEIPQNEFIGFIPKLRADVDHILFSLNNLLSWGQAQMKNDVTKPAIIPLKNHVDDSIRLLTENAMAKNITLTNTVPEHSYVWVDGNQMDIIIRNLISNAIKFTPENGKIKISAIQDGESWKIQVKDNGIGMPENIRESIFCSDKTVTTFGTNNEKGTGLGLSLCKEMVERNSGEIWVESELKKGTSFFFTIPRVDKEKFKQAS
ncbi:tetratricopeptide repeat-containing sensor histidine kinase [Croceivirga thetidis]|uniref:histidine kinase n=1 Tax=Croceivirga thetidis TaxID=2721623 RepID=A0ABX1GR37_9FLAO|nr:tetratricopeptide repeat-containing sensor histidine kinase [Croceivirga thetidis]NKI32088.1 sensor histidine kinase [Croceivirga thetidis]